MSQWFTVKIQYHKEKEGGKIQKVTEEYLFDALTYGEVEQRVMQELAENLRFEFNLVNIAKTQVHEIFCFETPENAYWFKCKVQFSTLEESSGKEKKVQQYMLILATSVADAYQKLYPALEENGFKIFEITAIQQTKITDVFEYHGSLMAEKTTEENLEKSIENPVKSKHLEELPVFDQILELENFQ